MLNTAIKSLLNPGNKVGLITPAGFINEEMLNKAIQNISSLGLKPIYYNSVLEKTAYLAGTDQSRLNELHSMYENENIKAIVCVRGGYGVTRIIDKINYDLIKKNPKLLIGYSDITALIAAIYKKTGIIGFHGIVGAGDFTKFTEDNFRHLFFSNSNEVNIRIFGNHKKNAYVINKGDFEGELSGGNLAVICSLTGTPFEPDWNNKIVFLEDVGEAPYKIDRMLTQLISGGKFNNVNGIIFGKFRDCEPEETESENSFSLKKVISERIKPLNIPAVYGFSFGHIKNKVIFPVGIKAFFNTETFSLSLKRKEINGIFN